MRKLAPALLAVLVVGAIVLSQQNAARVQPRPAIPANGAPPASTTDKSDFSGYQDVPQAPVQDAVANAFANHQSNLQVYGQGVVYRVLPDDTSGSRHQRFLLRTPSGLSLLIAHNIDLAPRIPTIRTGDVVDFYGVYEWNEKGGVVHWTHRDPGGSHVAGWLQHRGRTYQ